MTNVAPPLSRKFIEHDRSSTGLLFISTAALAASVFEEIKWPSIKVRSIMVDEGVMGAPRVAFAVVMLASLLGAVAVMTVVTSDGTLFEGLRGVLLLLLSIIGGILGSKHLESGSVDDDVLAEVGVSLAELVESEERLGLELGDVSVVGLGGDHHGAASHEECGGEFHFCFVIQVVFVCLLVDVGLERCGDGEDCELSRNCRVTRLIRFTIVIVTAVHKGHCRI